MWPFRRSRRGNATEAVHRASRGEWRQVAPMPIVQATPIATVVPEFEHQLATRANPSFLEPLGHHVVSGAPSGTVGGLAVPEPRSFTNPVPSMPQPRISYGMGDGHEAPTATTAADGEGPTHAPTAPSARELPPRPLVQARLADLPTFPVRPDLVSARTSVPRPVQVPGDASQSEKESIIASDVDAESIGDPPHPPVAQTTPDDITAPADAGERVEQTRPTVAQRSPLDPSGHPTPPIAAGQGDAHPAPPVVDAGVTDAQRGPAPPDATSPPPRRSDRVPRPRIGAPIDPDRDAALPVQATTHDGAATDSASSTTKPAPTLPSTTSEQTPPSTAADRPLLGDQPLAASPVASSADAAGRDDVSPQAAPAIVRPVLAARLPLADDAVGAAPGGHDEHRRVPDGSVIGDRPDYLSTSVTHEHVSTVPESQATVPTLGLEADATTTLDGEPGIGPRPSDAPGPSGDSPRSSSPAVQRTVGGPTPPPPAGLSVGGATAVVRRDPVHPVPIRAHDRPMLQMSALRSSAPDHAASAALPSDRHVGLLGDRPGLVCAPDITSADSYVSGPPGTTQSVQRASSVTSRGRDTSGAAPARRDTLVARAPAETRSDEIRSDEPRSAEPVPGPTVELLVSRQLQREVDADSSPGPGEQAGETITRTATAAEPAAAPSAPRQPTEAEVQELVRALYPPLRRRLSRDLLLDRERSGYRTDIRF